MAQPSLKTLFRRKKDLGSLFSETLSLVDDHVIVEDADGEQLLGNRGTALPEKHPLFYDNRIIGWVRGNNKALHIAGLLNQWLMLEAEKKKLGAEVLQMYREINLIYHFSEKLAASINPASIAKLTLEEAGQLIRFISGVVVVVDEETRKLMVMASTGSPLLPEQDWQSQDGFFQLAALSGRSEIAGFPEQFHQDEEALVLLYATLKVQQKVLGAVVLAGTSKEEFSAADLKLLTTLSLHAAGAMESSWLHEKSKARALREQREKLMFELARKHPFFKKVLATIEAHLANPDLSIDHLSKAVNLSPSQLQRKLVALTDRTPVQIIRDLRLRKAKDLLCHTDLTVAEIAWQTGFNDPSYFTRLFTREMQLPPTAWKENQPTP